MIILVLEGLDKCGKHSQTKLLTTRLKQNDYLTLKSEFHDYSSPTGELIMKWLTGKYKADQKVIEFIMSADKQAKQLWFEQLEKQLDYLVLDRYTLSQYVYAKANGIDPNWTEQLQKYMRKPDLNIIIDIPAQVSMNRKGKHNDGNNDKYESDYEMLTRVRDNYLSYADSHKNECIVLNGLKTIEEVHEDIWNKLLELGVVENRK
ncbi:dTMP kinase [Paenibacillus naphthalenovorans]|uniref:Thymidylate kinase n=1 Tax=Paenibacillus naphthalenovorans TaxID=162209 RepID=A0A0U2UG92_9BACL|nr:dTMP kinase [Paenibacillus naphthalenovorans]ALS22188.1 thymidylate kinase [Paenibacillus naphthalenovorans]